MANLPALAAGAHPDAVLLSLRDLLKRTWQAYTAALAEHSAAEAADWSLRDLPENDRRRVAAGKRHDATDALVESTCSANREIVDEMRRRPARTIDGLALKACVSLEHEVYEELVTSIMDDILAMGGGHA